jgi:hypothetical protein
MFILAAAATGLPQPSPSLWFGKSGKKQQMIYLA